MTLKIKTVLTCLKSTKNEVKKWKVNGKVNGKHINTIFSPKNWMEYSLNEVCNIESAHINII